MAPQCRIYGEKEEYAGDTFGGVDSAGYPYGGGSYGGSAQGFRNWMFIS